MKIFPSIRHRNSHVYLPICPLTRRVVGAPPIVSQPAAGSISTCLPQPSVTVVSHRFHPHSAQFTSSGLQSDVCFIKPHCMASELPIEWKPPKHPRVRRQQKKEREKKEDKKLPKPGKPLYYRHCARAQPHNDPGQVVNERRVVNESHPG